MLQRSAAFINAGPSLIFFCSDLASWQALARLSYNSQIFITYAQNGTLFCSLFAAHLQLKWLFDQTGLRRNALSHAYNVC